MWFVWFFGSGGLGVGGGIIDWGFFKDEEIFFVNNCWYTNSIYLSSAKYVLKILHMYHAELKKGRGLYLLLLDFSVKKGEMK